MKLSYDKEEWERIPERIRELDSTELDFTQHPERELHKMEMDRRLYIQSNFLRYYSWDGSKSLRHPDVDDEAVREAALEGIREEDDEEEEDDDPQQPGLEDFIDSV